MGWAESHQGTIPGSVARQFTTTTQQNGSYYKAFDCGDIFNGIVVETESDNADTLRVMGGVVNVWPMKTVPLVPALNKTKTTQLPRFHNYSMHQWTGVDKLHAAGIRGKGVKVAIVDTGIDYTHKAVCLSRPPHC